MFVNVIGLYRAREILGIFNLLFQLEKMLHKTKYLLAHSGANVHFKSVVCTVLFV